MFLFQNLMELTFAVLAVSPNEKLIKTQGLISAFLDGHPLAQTFVGGFQRVD